MNTDSAQKNLQEKLYQYSRRYLPHPWLAKIGLKSVTPERFTEFFIHYGFAVITAGFAFLFSFILNRFLDQTPFYFFFILSTVASVWVGGKRAGFINVILNTLSAYILFKSPLISLYLGIYFVGGLLIIYLFDVLRQSDTLKKYKRREELYSQSFVKLQDQYLHALEEIRARDEFLSIASHELKTPLTTMLLKLNYMLNNVQHVALAKFSIPELMKVLENAQTQIKWLSTMINDLLNVSLITTGRMDLEKKDADLVQLTRQVIENFQEVAKDEGYEIRLEAKAPVIGHWDNARLEQAITNLLSNAIKYGKNKPIDIAVANSGNKGTIAIRDRGIGISGRDQKLLFDRFKRAVPTSEKKKGLGVGLYIAKQIVTAHQGKITVASFPQTGTTFTIELPLK